MWTYQAKKSRRRLCSSSSITSSGIGFALHARLLGIGANRSLAHPKIHRAHAAMSHVSRTHHVVMAIDEMHNKYPFVLVLTTHDHAPVVLIGQLFPGVTNGQFDALTYAVMVPATIYFVSNTLARRLAREQSAGMFWSAPAVGTALSALANAGTMFAAATG
jgi:hypothetical protein